MFCTQNGPQHPGCSPLPVAPGCVPHSAASRWSVARWAPEEPKAAGRGIISLSGSVCSAFCHVPVSAPNQLGGRGKLSARHRRAPRHLPAPLTGVLPACTRIPTLVHTVSPAATLGTPPSPSSLPPIPPLSGPWGPGPRSGRRSSPWGAPTVAGHTLQGISLPRGGISLPVEYFPAERGISLLAAVFRVAPSRLNPPTPILVEQRAVGQRFGVWGC